MIRPGLAVPVALLAVPLVAAWTLAPPAPLPARFAAADCRRIALVDAGTGWAIRGAEDIVLVPDGETLILSAQDRLDTARAEGGLYAVSLRELDTGGTVAARPLLGPRGDDDPFRPHGIALSPDGTRLAVVNHVSQDEGVIEIGSLGPAGWRPDRRVTDPRLCRANDLNFAGNADGTEVLHVTIDRADCTMSLRDLAGGTGSVLRIEDGAVSVARAGLEFPNGIAGDWVAETRAALLSGPGGVLPLPGGPDNLSTSDGRLIAALHPDLVRTGLYLHDWVPRLASRIVAVDPATGAVEVLYDDPAGALFSGATAGVLAGGRLVAGSVRDTGLLHCRAPA